MWKKTSMRKNSKNFKFHEKPKISKIGKIHSLRKVESSSFFSLLEWTRGAGRSRRSSSMWSCGSRPSQRANTLCERAMGCRYSPQRMDEYMTWTSTVGEWGEFFQKTLSLLASENINGLRERPAPRVHSSNI